MSVEDVHERVIDVNRDEGFTDMEGFRSYLGAVSYDGKQRFFSNVFDTQEQAEEATAKGKSHATNSTATNAVLASTHGSITFDYVCADRPDGGDGGDSSTSGGGSSVAVAALASVVSGTLFFAGWSSSAVL